MKIVLINGCPRAGKDTFVQFCQKYDSNIRNISTIDPVKKAALFLGWDGVKDEKSRKYLSDLKDLSEEYCNLSKVYVKQYIEDCKKMKDIPSAVFIHCREPQQIEELKKELKAITLLITTTRIQAAASNHADAEVSNYSYNYIISNNDSLKEFEIKAENFLHEIGVLS